MRRRTAPPTTHRRQMRFRVDKSPPAVSSTAGGRHKSATRARTISCHRRTSHSLTPGAIATRMGNVMRWSTVATLMLAIGGPLRAKAKTTRFVFASGTLSRAWVRRHKLCERASASRRSPWAADRLRRGRCPPHARRDRQAQPYSGRRWANAASTTCLIRGKVGPREAVRIESNERMFGGGQNTCARRDGNRFARTRVGRAPRTLGYTLVEGGGGRKQSATSRCTIITTQSSRLGSPSRLSATIGVATMVVARQVRDKLGRGRIKSTARWG